MIRGWLVYNGFYQTGSFQRLYDALTGEAKLLGLSIRPVSNDSLCPLPKLTGADRPDFVLFWDKDIRLAYQLERQGIPVFNSAGSIALCDDKTLTYLALSGRVPMPETILCPTAFYGFTSLDFLTRVEETLSFPFIIKEGCGSFGQQVYLVKEHGEGEKLLRQFGEKPLLFQRFIASSAGRDLRVYVCGGRCVASMERIAPEGDFRANIMNGGTARPHRLTPEEEQITLDAVQALGLTFGGVDLLFGREGPLVCEVNSNAHFSGLQKMTDINIPKEILLSILREINQPISN